jgi:DNA-binding MarR family transcriptional regulator
MSATMTGTATALEMLHQLGDCMSPEASLRQAMVLLTIAQAGTLGTDSATIERKVGMSAAGVSRTIRVLSDVSYNKGDGYGLITLELDPTDNRRRVVRLSPTGEKAIAKLAGMISRKR